MLKIWGSILMVVSLFVIAGVPTESLPIMIAIILFGMMGFIQGFIMLRLEK